MEVVHPRCAGLDVSKRDVKVCVRIQGRGSRPTRATVTTWGSTTRQILALRDMLVAEGVGMVVITDARSADAVMSSAHAAGVEAWLAGRVVRGSGNVILE